MKWNQMEMKWILKRNCGNNNLKNLNKNIEQKILKKKCKWNFKNYILNEKFGWDIIKMHYVGPSIVLMIWKMLKGEVFKSWNALFVIVIMWITLIQALKTKMFNNIL